MTKPKPKQTSCKKRRSGQIQGQQELGISHLGSEVSGVAQHGADEGGDARVNVEARFAVGETVVKAAKSFALLLGR